MLLRPRWERGVTRNSVTVSNTAVSGALNPDYVFRRFYQGDKKEGSIGLGLSLTESIAKLYGIVIRYHAEDGLHHFAVIFPESMIIFS